MSNEDEQYKDTSENLNEQLELPQERDNSGTSSDLDENWSGFISAVKLVYDTRETSEGFLGIAADVLDNSIQEAAELSGEIEFAANIVSDLTQGIFHNTSNSEGNRRKSLISGRIEYFEN